MARCVMAVVAVAPCQCFSPGENQITSPGRISSMGPPSHCAQPHPLVTTRVCPKGCVCHAVRAPGSKVTLAPTARAGAPAANRGSMRTVPVKYSAGPLPEGCEPFLLISISKLLRYLTRAAAIVPPQAKSLVYFRPSRLRVDRDGEAMSHRNPKAVFTIRGGKKQSDNSENRFESFALSHCRVSGVGFWGFEISKIRDKK